jgi:hypothetical protein
VLAEIKIELALSLGKPSPAAKINGQATTLGAKMPEDSLPSIEEMVTAEINGVFESFAPTLLARERGEASNEDSQAMLECWASVVQRQGLILARMSMLPWRKAELKSNMSDIVNRAPAWMNAHFRGERVMTLELYAQGMAQTMATQRVAFEQVLAEQVSEPVPLRELLAEAPIPAAPEKMGRSELLSALAKAMMAHTEALAGIAADVDAKLREHLERQFLEGL